MFNTKNLCNKSKNREIDNTEKNANSAQSFQVLDNLGFCIFSVQKMKVAPSYILGQCKNRVGI